MTWYWFAMQVFEVKRNKQLRLCTVASKSQEPLSKFQWSKQNGKWCEKEREGKLEHKLNLFEYIHLIMVIGCIQNSLKPLVAICSIVAWSFHVAAGFWFFFSFVFRSNLLDTLKTIRNSQVIVKSYRARIITNWLRAMWLSGIKTLLFFFFRSMFNHRMFQALLNLYFAIEISMFPFLSAVLYHAVDLQIHVEKEMEENWRAPCVDDVCHT